MVTSAQPFQHAIELVKAIRKHNRGAEICVAVAGYPDVHPDASSAAEDLHFLRLKVVAGADFIITQMCFDAAAVRRFVWQCRQIGIGVPILAGVYVPWSYKELVRMCEICKVKMPIMDAGGNERLRDDQQQFQRFSRQKCADLCKELLSAGIADGIHFFTLNRFDLVQEVVKDIMVDSV